MTRDEIQDLAKSLALNLHETDTIDSFINDVFYELGLRTRPPFIQSKIKAITSGTSTYTFETDMLRVVYLIMFDELLSQASENDLEAYSKTWRTDTGDPLSFTQDIITARSYRLYPEPDFTSDPLIPINGQPWGEDFPDDSLVLIYSDNREDNIPSFYSLPIAFDTLFREFSYPSDHEDQEFSLICQDLSKLLYLFAGG
jgi:hypothetical protein